MVGNINTGHLLHPIYKSKHPSNPSPPTIQHDHPHHRRERQNRSEPHLPPPHLLRPFLIASRSGTSPNPTYAPNAVTFNWFDPSTFNNPFTAATEKGLAAIDKLYLISPPAIDPLPVAKPFIDLAVEKGIKRIVFLSSSDVEMGDETMKLGQVHKYLDGLEGLWYAVLRPTWFVENLAQTHASSIIDEDKIYTACDNGLVPFISAEDIAQAVYDGLFSTGEKAWKRGRAPRVLGPELLTYDQVAEILSTALGRKITHTHVTPGEPRASWEKLRIPKEYQTMLERLELIAADGQEERFFNDAGKSESEGGVDSVMGKRTAREYVEREKAVWERKE